MTAEEKVQVLEEKVKLLEALVEIQKKLITAQSVHQPIDLSGGLLLNIPTVYQVPPPPECQHEWSQGTGGTFCTKCGLVPAAFPSVFTVQGGAINGVTRADLGHKTFTGCN